MANEIAVTSRVTTNKELDIVGIPNKQETGKALEAITVFAPVRYDATAGTFRNGNATDSTEGNIYGIATRTVVAGESLTAIRDGRVSGLDLSGLNFGAPVYISDTDARLSTVAGTVNIKIGFVSAHTAVALGSAPTKILTVEPPVVTPA